MTHRLFRAALASVAASVLLTGCARWIELTPPAGAPQELTARSIADDDRVPLVMEAFHVVQNGAAQNPSVELERRILNRVQETGLFSSLVPFGAVRPGADKAVAARITVEETIDPRAGEAAWKGFIIGASMFLLSPAIELDYAYAARTTLELERWDGEVKRYEARSTGTAHYNLFGATPIVLDELKGQVTEACLTDLVDQLVRDTGFYVASGTPLPDGAIRTVTVKARKPAPAPGVLPVSSAPAP
jgi:hypothetical protein